MGGNWLMKWDELKKFPWYTHRLMHRKRVTCELHDSYFHLMTIKHAISKIEWALNYYIAQSRQKSRRWSSSPSGSCSQFISTISEYGALMPSPTLNHIILKEPTELGRLSGSYTGDV